MSKSGYITIELNVALCLFLLLTSRPWFFMDSWTCIKFKLIASYKVM